jgi:hypothetical protein
MARMTDQDDQTPLGDVTLALAMDFGDQRTRSVKDMQPARVRIELDYPCHPMRTEDGDRPGGYFREVFDEARAFCAQAFDDMAVVNDFVSNVDRSTKLRECLFDDVDGPDHAGAKAARLREHYLHRSVLFRATTKTVDSNIEPGIIEPCIRALSNRGGAMWSMSAMIHYCALPDKSIGNLARSDGHTAVVAAFDS